MKLENASGVAGQWLEENEEFVEEHREKLREFAILASYETLQNSKERFEEFLVEMQQALDEVDPSEILSTTPHEGETK